MMTATKERTVRVVEDQETPALTATRQNRPRSIALLGSLDENQGRLTFTGRLTLDQFADITTVHNRKWAVDAGAKMEEVTQREIIQKHVNGIALFMLQGLVHTAITRSEQEKTPEGAVLALKRIQRRIGETTHYGIPGVALVLENEPAVRVIKDDDGVPVAAKLMLPAGATFAVADGQHRRQAARMVRDFLYSVIGNHRTPKGSKLYIEDAPLSADEVEAWIAVQSAFQSASTISYEAHIGITVEEARQLFSNLNSHVRAVAPQLNLEFDTSNKINEFAKTWLAKLLKNNGEADYDLKTLSAINGFLFLGKPSIRTMPFDLSNAMKQAKEFWEMIVGTKEWSRKGSAIHEPAILKGLAKAFFMCRLARRNSQEVKDEQMVEYIKKTRFDDAWIGSIHGMRQQVLSSDESPEGIWHFSPTHNETVALLVKKILR